MKKRVLSFSVMFFVICVGMVSAQNSVDRLVRDYENSLYNLEAAVNRLSTKEVCSDNDFYSLNEYIQKANDAFYRLYSVNDDLLDPYQSRLSACRRQSRQIFEKARNKARQAGKSSILDSLSE